MIFHETNGLKNTDIRRTVPIYLTDTYDVIEGPSYWAIDVAKRGSKSDDTLKQYTTTLARFLQWLDNESSKGAETWQLVDEDVINAYISFLVEERDEKGRPSDSTIEAYIAILEYFYKWARKEEYIHYWEMDIKKVTIQIKNKSMINRRIEVEKRSFKLQTGKQTHVDRERDKFILKENMHKIITSFDDVVYAFIALVFWQTGLRPKELFQLPYMGEGLNAGLKRYQDEELKNLQPILFEFESKGKRRSIKFPSDIWEFICRAWMPLRVERATKYKEKHGIMPRNSVLFLSANGSIVTRKMLRDNFTKVTEKDDFPIRKLTPYMFRHSFATYFVYDRLKALNMLGKPYDYNAVIDAELKEWMGHSDIDTTYKYYVHLLNRYFKEDLLIELDKKDNKELFDAIVKM